MDIAPFEVSLKDSKRILIRPVVPADRPLLEAGFRQLSDQSRFFRFLRPTRHPSDNELAQFVRTNDDDHEAIGAVDISRDPPQPVAIARYFRLRGLPEHAEIAVTVIDSHHGAGLGTLLIGTLARHATRNDISGFLALVHRENTQMLRLLRDLGATVERREHTEVEFLIPLHRNPDRYPQTAAGDGVRSAYRLARATP